MPASGSMRFRGRPSVQFHARRVPFLAALPALLVGLAAAAVVLVGAVLLSILAAPFRQWARRSTAADAARRRARGAAEPEGLDPSISGRAAAAAPGRAVPQIEDARYEEVV